MQPLVRGLVVLASLSACGAPCDQTRLRTAADTTDAMMQAWDPRTGALPDYGLAVRGLQNACPGLPRGFDFYLEHSVQPQPDMRSSELVLTPTPLRDDPAGLKAMRAHCPNYQEIADSIGLLPYEDRLPAMYDGCKFARLGLIDRAAISETTSDPQTYHAHALYLWLLDGGAPPEVARAIVRPILASTDELMIVARDVRLPATANGNPTRDHAPTMLVTPFQVTLDHGRLANLTNGALDEADKDQGLVPTVTSAVSVHLEMEKGRRDAAEPRMVLAADASLSWATLGPLAYSAWRAGFTDIDIDALAKAPLRPLVVVPLVTRGTAPRGSLEIGPTQLRLRCDGEDGPPRDDPKPAELSRCGPTLSLAVTADTTLPRIVDVLATLTGHAAIVELLAPS